MSFDERTIMSTDELLNYIKANDLEYLVELAEAAELNGFKFKKLSGTFVKNDGKMYFKFSEPAKGFCPLWDMEDEGWEALGYGKKKIPAAVISRNGKQNIIFVNYVSSPQIMDRNLDWSIHGEFLNHAGINSVRKLRYAVKSIGFVEGIERK